MPLRSVAVRVMAVVPTYNEVANLEILVRGLRDVEPGIGIVIVDDDSPDGTAQVARRLAAEIGDIVVIDRPAKLGLGSAYRRGIAHAVETGADVCVQIDADLSHDPADLPALLANISHGADLAIGSRYVPRRAHRAMAVVTPLAVAVGEPLRGRCPRVWRSTMPPRDTGRTAARRCGGWTSTR